MYHYAVPFLSLTGTPYLAVLLDTTRLSDDEVLSPSPFYLTAGESPLIMDEDSDADPFTPVRTLTGTLSIVNKTGALSSVIAPAHNTATRFYLYAGNAGTDPKDLYQGLKLNANGAATTTLLPAAGATLVLRGCLSCESYEQQYSSRPQYYDLTVHSILETAKSVRLPQSAQGQKTFRALLIDCLQALQSKVGKPFDFISYPITDNLILAYLTDATTLFTERQIDNEFSTTYLPEPPTVYDVISRICTFMGWTAREAGTTLFFQRIGEQIGYYFEEYDDFIDYTDPAVGDPCVIDRTDFHTLQLGDAVGYDPYSDDLIPPTTHLGYLRTLTRANFYPLTTTPLSELTYRGTNHRRYIDAGARSVEVIANVKTDNLSLSLPACPDGNFLASTRAAMHLLTPAARTLRSWYLYLLPHATSTPYSNLTIYYRRFLLERHLHRQDGYTDYDFYFAFPTARYESDFATVRSHLLALDGTDAPACILRDGKADNSTTDYEAYTGAFFTRYNITYREDAAQSTYQQALHLSLCPRSNNNSGSPFNSTIKPEPLFTLRSTLTQVIPYDGYLQLQADYLTLYSLPANHLLSVAVYDLYIQLQFGSLYFDGTNWTDAPSAFPVRAFSGAFHNNYGETTRHIARTNGFLVPVPADMSGSFSISICDICIPDNASCAATSNSEEIKRYHIGSGIMAYPAEMLLRSLTVNYIPNSDIATNDRTSNHYYRLLNADFADDRSITTDIASDMNNRPSPSVIRTFTQAETDARDAYLYAASKPTDHILYIEDYTINRIGNIDPAAYIARRPEHDLLDRMAEFYATARRRLILQVEARQNGSITGIVPDDDPADLPRTLFTGFDGLTYLPIAQSHDYRLAQSTLTLIELGISN